MVTKISITIATFIINTSLLIAFSMTLSGRSSLPDLYSYFAPPDLIVLATFYLPVVLMPFFVKNNNQKILSIGNALVAGSLLAIIVNAYQLFMIRGLGSSLSMEAGWPMAGNIVLGLVSATFIIVGVILIAIRSTTMKRA